MTHPLLALKDYKDMFEKGHLYLMSDTSFEELNIAELIRKKVVREVSEEEGLKIYKSNL